VTASSPSKHHPTHRCQQKAHSLSQSVQTLAQSYQRRATEFSRIAAAAVLRIQSRTGAFLRTCSPLRSHYPTLYLPGARHGSWGSFHSHHLEVGSGPVWRAVAARIASSWPVLRMMQSLYLPCEAECAGPVPMVSYGPEGRRRTDAIGFHALNNLTHAHSKSSKSSRYRMTSFGSGDVVH
jgi:hypothetical protein